MNIKNKITAYLCKNWKWFLISYIIGMIFSILIARESSEYTFSLLNIYTISFSIYGGILLPKSLSGLTGTMIMKRSAFATLVVSVVIIMWAILNVFTEVFFHFEIL